MGRRKATETEPPTQGCNPPEVEPEGESKPTSTSVNGVLVTLEGGKLQIQTLGDTRPLEAPTLLRKAAKDVERELGID